VNAGDAAHRVDRLLAQLRAGPDPRAAAVAEELVRCLVRLYGAALERMVEISDPRLRHEFAADPLVESLMLVHDLHPLDADARIRRALHGLRHHAGDLHYDGTDDAGVARVRVPGGAPGCRSSLRQAIETAVLDAAPELTGVGVEVEAAAPVLLQITSRAAS
jgi:Fe-S cluster biogenesis protein NfuA